MEHTTATRRLPGVPTLLSLAIALGCGTLATPILAVPAAQAQEYRFEIPAQSLDAALAAFSAVTRVQVLVGAEVTQGLRSRASAAVIHRTRHWPACWLALA